MTIVPRWETPTQFVARTVGGLMAALLVIVAWCVATGHLHPAALILAALTIPASDTADRVAECEPDPVHAPTSSSYRRERECSRVAGRPDS